MKTRRLLSLFLCVCMILMLVPMPQTTFASGGVWNGGAIQPQGEGTLALPYQIATAENLAWFAQEVCSGPEEKELHAELTADIMLNDTSNLESWDTVPPANTWNPIGNRTGFFKFKGVFNGNNHTVSGIYINSTEQDEGFFGRIQDAVIENLKIDKSYIKSSNDNIGGLCAENSNSTIRNCSINATVSGGNSVGGICSLNNGGNIINCINYGNISGKGNAVTVGGLCASSEGNISDSYNLGNISSSRGDYIENNDAVGGICGRNRGSISNSYSVGSVTGTRFVGLLCGVWVGSITNSYFLGTSPDEGIGWNVYEQTNTTAPKTQEEFASGAVAQLLGNGFAQSIGSDAFPVFRAADNINAVYKLTYMNGGSIFAVQYYNSGNTVDAEAAGIPSPDNDNLAFAAWKDLPATMPGNDVTVSAEFTNKTTLVSITEPTVITGLANGTEKTATALGLPLTVTLVTDGGNVNADVSWDVNSCPYDPTVTAEQTFTVNGTVTLPDGVINPSDIPLAVSITVTVNAASTTDKTLVSISEPAPITGLANGTANTASALGLPAKVTLVTDGGHVNADVSWDVNSCAYDPSVTTEQIFTVEGTVTLPVVVINPSDIPLTTRISVSVMRASGSDSGGSGGNSGSSRPPAPVPMKYYATAKAENSSEITLPVTVNRDAGTAFVELDSLRVNQGGSVVTIPSIPDVGTYSVGIPASNLSAANTQESLIVHTEKGSITIPSNMLAGIDDIDGSKAKIAIGIGDKESLPDEVKTVIGDRPLIQLTLNIDGRQTEWNNPDAPVTVSLPYTPTAEELANPGSIVICYIDASGNVTTIPNGRYDAATGNVIFNTTHFSFFAVGFRHVAFSDVANDAWYAKAVTFIAAREITTGTGDGKYNPAAKLTRGEFIVLIMRAYGISPDENSADNFSDAGNTYYTGYLAAAKRLGITSGLGNNICAPNTEITRQEMFTMLYNALKFLGRLPQSSFGKELFDFTDAGQVDSWAIDSMTLLVKTGTVAGSNGKLTPTDTTTRAEIAQVLYNLLDTKAVKVLRERD